MDLQNPTIKMSKSAAQTKGVIYLSDSNTQISKKIKSAVTDSSSEVSSYEAASIGLKNLFDIYGALTQQSGPEVCKLFAGKAYGSVKSTIADAVVAEISPIRDRTLRYLDDRGHLHQILRKGAERAAQVAEETRREVFSVMGFIAP